MVLKNPLLNTMNSDYLYHLGINISNTKDTRDIQMQFGDVKVVCMGGTISRMLALAKYLRSVIDTDHINDEFVDLCEKAHRFAVFKVGPVLCCSHGIGMPSMSVLLHELIKLLKYANCKDPIFIRIGTCGGLGITPGTVVVSKGAINGYLRKEHELAILGERVVRPTKFDESVFNAIVKCREPGDNFDVILGNTMAAECFYEGQGRLDGAVCSYTLKDKMNFLQKCYDYGIRNIEMESTMFASLTHHLGIKAAIVCIAMLDRLQGDQVTNTCEQKEEFEKRPLTIVVRYIQQILTQSGKV